MTPKRQRRLLLLLSLLITTISLFNLRSTSAAFAADSPAPNSDPNITYNYIRSNCNTTLYPDICFTSLSRYATAIQQNPANLARVAVGLSLSRARRMAAYVSNLSRQSDYGSDPRASSALHDCFSNFGDAVDEIHDSLKQMRQIGGAADAGDSSSSPEAFRFQMSNVQTWMSAALTDEETCTDGFEDVPEGVVKSDVCDRATEAKKFTSNALALVNSYAARGLP